MSATSVLGLGRDPTDPSNHRLLQSGGRACVPISKGRNKDTNTHNTTLHTFSLCFAISCMGSEVAPNVCITTSHESLSVMLSSGFWSGTSLGGEEKQDTEVRQRSESPHSILQFSGLSNFLIATDSQGNGTQTQKRLEAISSLFCYVRFKTDTPVLVSQTV